MRIETDFTTLWDLVTPLMEAYKHKWDDNYNLLIHTLGAIKWTDKENVINVFGPGIEKYFTEKLKLDSKDIPIEKIEKISDWAEFE